MPQASLSDAARPTDTPRTIPEMFLGTVQRMGEKPALKAKLPKGGWRTITYAGFGRYAEELAGFLLSLGVQKGDRVAIMAPNSPEWAITDLGMQLSGALNVAIYETLTPDKVQYILQDSGARIAFAGTKKEAEALAGSLKGTKLELVVTFDPVGGKLGKQVLDFEDALAQGKAWNQQNAGAVKHRAASVEPEDLSCLLYTSGTTGEPKGVMLSHGNFVSNVLASLEVLPFASGEVFLSFLPLSHSFERMAGHYVPFRLGCTVVYAESVEKLPENLLEVKPTIMTSVPRLFEKMWARVEAGAKAQGKEKVFRRAVQVGREHTRITRVEKRKAPLGLALQHALFDRLVFAKVRERMGGNIRLFVTGGAHIREDLEWNLTAVGLPVLGGYGLTETSPVISVNSFLDWRPGSVGKPIPGVEVRIAEDGEILCKGPNVMQGYFNKPDATQQTINAEGWLHTGDIGHLDQDGFLFVTDRKKELFKTSGGKYIAPQPIEDLLRSSPLIDQAVCIGNDRNHVTALLGPNFENVVPWAKAQGLPTEREALLAHPKLREALQRDVDKANAKLSRFETVKQFRLLPRELTQEGGELTPTLKVKRRIVEQKYSALIEEMYAEPGPAERGGHDAPAASAMA